MTNSVNTDCRNTEKKWQYRFLINRIQPRQLSSYQSQKFDDEEIPFQTFENDVDKLSNIEKSIY